MFTNQNIQATEEEKFFPVIVASFFLPQYDIRVRILGVFSGTQIKKNMNEKRRTEVKK